jgi:hypothetical protein
LAGSIADPELVPLLVLVLVLEEVEVAVEVLVEVEVVVVTVETGPVALVASGVSPLVDGVAAVDPGRAMVLGGPTLPSAKASAGRISMVHECCTRWPAVCDAQQGVRREWQMVDGSGRKQEKASGKR